MRPAAQLSRRTTWMAWPAGARPSRTPHRRRGSPPPRPLLRLAQPRRRQSQLQHRAMAHPQHQLRQQQPQQERQTTTPHWASAKTPSLSATCRQRRWWSTTAWARSRRGASTRRCRWVGGRMPHWLSVELSACTPPPSASIAGHCYAGHLPAPQVYSLGFHQTMLEVTRHAAHRGLLHLALWRGFAFLWDAALQVPSAGCRDSRSRWLALVWLIREAVVRHHPSHPTPLEPAPARRLCSLQKRCSRAGSGRRHCWRGSS